MAGIAAYHTPLKVKVMVTHTRNSCSAFNPSKVHTRSREHTHREHTPGAVGSHLCCGARGAVGVRCLAQGHLSRGIESGESAVHSLPPATIPAGPSLELATFGYESDSLTIRPRLPPWTWVVSHWEETCWCHDSSVVLQG